MRKLAMLMACLCVGTILALSIILAYAWTKGLINPDKLSEMVAVVQGVSKQPEKDEKPKQPDETSEQPSLDDMEQIRAVATRHLELREQALSEDRRRIRYEMDQLKDERTQYDQLRESFTKELEIRTNQSKNKGKEDVRLIWENIKPKQAKEQLLKMFDDGDKDVVVELLTAMPIAKRAKIIGEFKTEDDNKKLDELLKMMRKGMPDSDLIDKTREQVQTFNKPST